MSAEIKNITVSGRIGSGATTLATHLGEKLGWSVLDGGKIMRKVQEDIGASVEETGKRPDQIDLDYEAKVTSMLKNGNHQIIQSHLAGFDAQGIPGVFKIFVVCEDREGEDKIEMRIDRLVNRDGKSIDQAKHEVSERDRQNLEKWRRLYVSNDPDWVYWDKKYYDLIVNTYEHNQEESLRIALDVIEGKIA